VNEFWSYHTIGDEVRFTLVHRLRDAPVAKSRATAPPRRKTAPPMKRAARPAPKGAAKSPVKKTAAPRRQKRK